jgi:hypothetical protein
MPEELLDGVQRRPVLYLGERPTVPEAVRVNAFLDAGLDGEAFAERAVAVPQRLALQCAEEPVTAS